MKYESRNLKLEIFYIVRYFIDFCSENEQFNSLPTALGVTTHSVPPTSLGGI